MALQVANPTSPGRRHYVAVVSPELSKEKPKKKALLAPISETGGRNNHGRITTRHRGGRVKRRYRVIDFLRRGKDGVPAVVDRLEYDPNRSAHVALLKYLDGEWRYIISPKGLKVGDKVRSGEQAPISLGNALPMRNIPVGTIVHCIEMKPGKGAQMARSAGASAQILAKEGEYVTLRLRSGEMRKIRMDCWATIGIVGNGENFLRKDGKAGRKRRKGVRPTVRGVAMNPVDHPLGGGEGRTSGGRPSCSPTGVPKGRKTRKKKKSSNKYIVRSRAKSKKK